jgi:hypothetical protein
MFLIKRSHTESREGGRIRTIVPFRCRLPEAGRVGTVDRGMAKAKNLEMRKLEVDRGIETQE